MDDFVPQDHLALSEDIWLSQLGKHAGIRWVEVRDAAKDPTMHRITVHLLLEERVSPL